MVKINSGAAQRTPHDTHKKILAYLSAGGFEEETRSRVFSDGERTIIVFFDESEGEYRYTEVAQQDASYGVDDLPTR